MARTHRAFTLIELLVVVAIIVALLAILMPSIASALRLGRVTQCTSRLHQQYVAMVAYTGDHLGALPNATSTYSWANNLANVYGGLRIEWDDARFSNLPDRLLNSYAGGAESEVWACPDDPVGTPRDSRAIPMPPARGVYHAVWGNSYQYNNLLVKANRPNTGGYGVYTRLSQINRLARVWIFQEWPAWDVMTNYTGRWQWVEVGNDRWSFHDPLGTPGNPDATGSITAFGDGHVGMIDYEVGLLDGDEYSTNDAP